MPGTGAAASYGDLLITSLVVLVCVCIAAFVVVRLVGRFLATGRVRGAHLLDVVARVPLEPRRSLYVVEVAGKTLLVGTSEMGLSVLSELDAGEVRARAVPRPSFGELVRSAWLRRGGAHRDAGEPAQVGAGGHGPTHVGVGGGIAGTGDPTHVGVGGATARAGVPTHVGVGGATARAGVPTHMGVGTDMVGATAPTHAGVTAPTHAGAGRTAAGAKESTHVGGEGVSPEPAGARDGREDA